MTKEYEFFQVRISGTLECKTSLHIGSGEVEAIEPARQKHPDGIHDLQHFEKNASYNRFIRNAAGQLYVPGSTLRGALRQGIKNSDKLFGLKNIKADQQNSGGKVRILDGVINPVGDIAPPAYWHPDDNTGLEAGIVMDSIRGVAEETKLFHFEIIPAGTCIRFNAEMDFVNHSDIDELMMVLEWWNGDYSHNLAARKSKSWGVLAWKDDIVIKARDSKTLAKWIRAEIEKEPSWEILGKRQVALVTSAKNIVLRCEQPLLVNEPGKIKKKNKERCNQDKACLDIENSLPDQIMYQQAGGKYALPAQSFTGLLRGTARKIILTQLYLKANKRWDVGLDKQADNMVEGFFGNTSSRSRIQCSNLITAVTKDEHLHKQYFIAIDRFTGGVAEKKLYIAQAMPPETRFEGYLGIKTPKAHEKSDADTEPGDSNDEESQVFKGLLYLVLRELESGSWLGWGKSKGYGLVKLECLNELVSSLLQLKSPDEIQTAVKAFNQKLGLVTDENEDESNPGNIQSGAVSSQSAASTAITDSKLPDYERNTSDDQFYNPYTFIPLSNKWTTESPDTPLKEALIEKNPTKNHMRHDLFLPDHHSGKITCQLTTVTDTLVGNEHNKPGDHETSHVKSYRHRGKVAFPANSIRGMIGNNIELLSQSSLRVLEDKPFTVREEEKDVKQKKIGVLIEEDEGYWKIQNDDNDLLELHKDTIIDLKTINDSVGDKGTELKLSNNKKVYYKTNEDSKVIHIAPCFNPKANNNQWYKKAWRKRFTPKSTFKAFSDAGYDNLLPWGTTINGNSRHWLHPAELLLGITEEQQKNSNQDENGRAQFSLASRLRFTDAIFNDESSHPQRVCSDDNLIILKILASPKLPSEYFYFHQDGDQLIPNGRKQYLRQHPDNVDRNSYRTRQEKNHTDQKIRCNPIVKDQTFTFDIHFHNLNDKELKLLLTALEPGEAFFHKLGLGKPLGLGTVDVKIEKIKTMDVASYFSQTESRFVDLNEQKKHELIRDLPDDLIDKESHEQLLEIGKLQSSQDVISYPLSYWQLKALHDEREELKALSEEELFLWHVDNKRIKNYLLTKGHSTILKALPTNEYKKEGEKLQQEIFSTKVTGIVKFFNETKGFGFIKQQNGPDVFAHKSDICGTGDEILTEGQTIKFYIKEGKKGPQAKAIEIIQN